MAGRYVSLNAQSCLYPHSRPDPVLLRYARQVTPGVRVLPPRSAVSGITCNLAQDEDQSRPQRPVTKYFAVSITRSESLAQKLRALELLRGKKR